MKRQLMIALIIICIGLTGLNQAYAGWQRGGNGYYRNGMENSGPRVQCDQLDSAVKEKLDIFFANTEGIRQQMAVKRAEKQALIRSANPELAAFSKVEGELFDLRTTMRQKAEEAGVTPYLSPTNGPVERRMSEDVIPDQ